MCAFVGTAGMGVDTAAVPCWVEGALVSALQGLEWTLKPAVVWVGVGVWVGLGADVALSAREPMGMALVPSHCVQRIMAHPACVKLEVPEMAGLVNMPPLTICPRKKPLPSCPRKGAAGPGSLAIYGGRPPRYAPPWPLRSTRAAALCLLQINKIITPWPRCACCRALGHHQAEHARRRGQGGGGVQVGGAAMRRRGCRMRASGWVG